MVAAHWFTLCETMVYRSGNIVYRGGTMVYRSGNIVYRGGTMVYRGGTYLVMVTSYKTNT